MRSGTIVFVTMASKEMGCHARMLMNANQRLTFAVSMQFATISLVPTIATV